MIYSHRIRLLMLAVVIIGGCLVLFYRLWSLQIEQQDDFIRKQPVTNTAKQRVPGARGRIVDRNGVEFARNETNMEIGINLSATEAAWKEKHREELRKHKIALPVMTYGSRGEEATDIIAILNEMVFPELNQLGLYRASTDVEKEKQKQEIVKHYLTFKGVIPFPYEKNLLQSDLDAFKRFSAYAENAPNIPGITLTERPKRRYPMKAMAGHLIGYIRENRKDTTLLPEEEKKAMEKENAEAVAAGLPKKLFFIEPDDFGINGLEKYMDDKLRPKPGERVWLINEHGRLTEEIESLRRDPLPGADVFMTIDARMQMIAEMALRDAGVGRGAVVISDPNSGAILAMASVPSYDPSIFISPQDITAIDEGYADLTQPFQARALRADAPGSTFKLMTAIAGSLAGKAGNYYPCPGFMDYGRPIACWIYRQSHGNHGGAFPLSTGIKFSCNCYFFQLGNAAGIERIDEAASYFGFGDVDNRGQSGIEVPGLEENGYVATKAWWSAHRAGPWTNSETAYISIGQGLMAATPLQICMLGAAVANGGKIYQPTLIHHTEEWQYDRNGQKQKVISKFTPKMRADLLQHGVKKRDMDNMREGMRLVVNDTRGTGKAAQSKLYVIAGKTGTAQKKGEGERSKVDDNRTWFMSFAPYEAPKIAVCVMVVNGKAGGAVPAPIAKRVIEQTLSLFPENEGKYTGRIPKVQPLAPAKGHFNFLEKPNFKDDDSAAPQEDEESGAPDEDSEDAAPTVGIPIPSKPAPKAEVVVEDDDSDKPLLRTKIQSVQFRMKTDPPNPPIIPVKAGSR